MKIGISKSGLLNWVIKFIILCLLLWIIQHQLNQIDDFGELSQAFVDSFDWRRFWAIILVLILTPMNWLVESIKWKRLVDRFQKIDLKTSLKSIFSGITLAIITPQRVGEYGGRLIYIEKGKKSNGLLATFISSVAQNLVNISIGMLASIYFCLSFLDLGQYILLAISVLFSALIILFFIIFFNLNYFIQKFEFLLKWKPFRSYGELLGKLQHYPRQDFNFVLVLAMFRYVIYTTQYILILYFFGFTASLLSLFIIVACIYLIQSGLPLPPVLAVLARGEIALIMFGFLNQNEISILVSTYLLWLINLLVPAVIGLMFIWNTDLIESFWFKTGRNKIMEHVE